MVRRALAVLLVWFSLVGILAAGAVDAQSLSFPVLTGRVVDEAALLTEADRAILTTSLAALEAKTGVQLVVVSLKSLQGAQIEDFGYQLGRFWRIGQKDKNSGALLIVAPNQRVVRIEVGYGLEGVLTDALTRTIIETSILPKFKTGDFAGGVKDGAEQIIQTLAGDQAGSSGRSARAKPEAPIWPFILAAVIGVAVLIVCAVTTAGRLCLDILQIVFLMVLSSGNRSSRGGSSFGGGGGGFGGGGSSGRW